MAITALLQINSAADLAGIQAAINGLVALGTTVKEKIGDLEKFSQVWSRLEVDVMKADAAAAGLIDTYEIMRAANKFHQADMNITEDQLANLTKATAAYAQATGEDATSSFNRFSTAIINGSSRGLKPLGIEMKSGGDKAKNFAKAMDELEKKVADVNVEAETFGEQMYALNNTIDTLVGLLWTSVQKDGAFGVFGETLGELNTSLGDFTSWFAEMNKLLPDSVNAQTVLSGVWREAVIIVDDWTEGIQRFFRAIKPGASGRYVSPNWGDKTSLADEADREMAALYKKAEQRRLAAGGEPKKKTHGSTTPGKGGKSKSAEMEFTAEEVDAFLNGRYAGVEGAVDRLMEEKRIVQENLETWRAAEEEKVKELSRAIFGSAAQMRSNQAESEKMLLTDELFKVQEEIESITAPGYEVGEDTGRRLREIDRGPETVQSMTERLDIMRAIRSEKYEMYQESLTFAGQFREAWAASTETMTAGAFAATAAYDALHDAWTASVYAVVTGEKTIGEAIRGILRERGLAIATEASWNALLHTALAIGAIARDQMDKAAEHWTAVAEFGATAAIAGALAGVGFAGAGSGGRAKRAVGSRTSSHFGDETGARPASSGGTSSRGSTNIEITLSGGAEGLFEAVATQNEKEKKSGRDSFGMN